MNYIIQLPIWMLEEVLQSIPGVLVNGNPGEVESSPESAWICCSFAQTLWSDLTWLHFRNDYIPVFLGAPSELDWGSPHSVGRAGWLCELSPQHIAPWFRAIDEVPHRIPAEQLYVSVTTWSTAGKFNCTNILFLWGKKGLWILKRLWCEVGETFLEIWRQSALGLVFITAEAGGRPHFL